MRLALLAAGLVLLAGCASTSGTPTSTERPAYSPPAVDDSNGAVDGVVADEEYVPVSNATVGLGRGGPITTTDRDGRFGFSHVAPGDHELFVAALGFEAAATKASVRAGETSSVTVLLARLPTNESRQETVQLNGRTTCSVSYRSSVNFLRPSCSLVPGAFPNDKWNIQYDLKPGFIDVLVETAWQPTYAFGNELFQIVRPGPFTQAENIRETEGRGPIRILVNQTEWAAWDAKYKTTYVGGGGRLSLSTFAAHNLVAPPSPVQLGLLIDQSFRVYSTSSHNGPMPGNYSALPDG